LLVAIENYAQKVEDGWGILKEGVVMLLWLLFVFMAGLLVHPVACMSKAEQKNSGKDDAYVKVEIRGTLHDFDRPPAKRIDWPQPYGITAPGSRRVPWNGGADRRAYGLEWELFFGDKKEWHELAKKLKGKTVLVRGTLKVFAGGGLNSPVMPRQVVTTRKEDATRSRLVQPGNHQSRR
jgi:hypothetical protein